MGRKIITSIRISESVFRKAKDLGLNVSKVAENALIEMIKRIEGSEPEKDCDCELESQNDWCGRRDLNPGRRLGRPKS